MLFCLGSAAAFGAMGVLGKLAYGEGVNVATLLTVRFALAAVLFAAIVAARGAARRGTVAAPRRGIAPRDVLAAAPRRGIAPRDVFAALALGAVGYAASAATFFAALARMDASLVSLVVYAFPALVMVAGAATGREPLERVRLVALGLAVTGLVLVVAGAGAPDAAGVALALAAAVAYAGYVLAGDGLTARVEPVALSALLCAGAAMTLGAGSLALGQLRLGTVTAAGWAWLAALALVSTVLAIGLFVAGLRRVGPTPASLLSMTEPVFTVLLAFAAFGERLSGPQLAGAALVLLASTAVSRAREAVNACSGGVA
jgi:drug/metabolite transporter (DMT)-like permease